MLISIEDALPSAPCQFAALLDNLYLALQYKKDIDNMERVQWKDGKTMQGWKGGQREQDLLCLMALGNPMAACPWLWGAGNRRVPTHPGLEWGSRLSPAQSELAK